MRMSALLEALTDKQREKLPASAFVFPDRDAWPIHDEDHALIAIQYMKAGRGDEADYPTIKKAIAKKWAKNDKVMRALASL